MRKEHHKMLREMFRSLEADAHKMLDAAYKCGALTESMKDKNSYVLPKAIITIQGRKEPYGPLDGSTKRDVANLAHFI